MNLDDTTGLRKRLSILENKRLKDFLISLGYSESNINEIAKGNQINTGGVELPEAKSLVKNIDMNFINKSYKSIQKNTSGRAVFTVGGFSCNSATKEYLREELIKKGYKVSNSFNSHGVDTLVVIW